MKKLSALLLALVFASTSAFAAVGVKYGNTTSTQATSVSSTTTATGPLQVTDINFQGGTTVSFDGSTLNIDPTTSTGDVTFQTSLLADGRGGSTVLLASSSTVIGATQLAAATILKSIGSLQEISTLPNGTKGQILTLQITSVFTGGTWTVTPTTATGFTTLKFTSVDQLATLLYVDSTSGWTLMNTNIGIVSSGNSYTGDVPFQGVLIASGRPTSSSTLASSSTSLGTGNLPYGLVVKSIGNVSGEATALHNGVKGQTLFISVVVCGTSGTWVITPDTSMVFKTLTIATAPVNACLFFFDTTIGWTPIGGTGTQTYAMKGLFGA